MRIQTKSQQIQELTGQVRTLRQAQELLVDNILSVQESDTTYTGNRYKTYSLAVEAAAAKYAGTADWGVIQVGNIVDIRAAYVIGQGIKVQKAPGVKDDAERELAFAERFIKSNSLDHELPQDMAREAEIEGKILLKLFPRPADPGDDLPLEGLDIALRWVSWTTTKYVVNVNADDYLQLESVTWTPTAGPQVKLDPSQCVYKRFSGRLDIPNDTMPRVCKCLTQIENLDMALRDWRKINHLYAAPTPHIQCEDAATAKSMSEAVDAINFRIGKLFVHTGTFGYAQPSAEGQAALENEIITLLKIVSGTTGVPIHFLGAPELTTKYGAASEGLLELISMSTAKEREIWRGGYQELLTKAMRMWNAETKKTPLRPELITVDLPVVTESQWQRLVDVWLPMRAAGEVTRETFLAQVPGIDVETEAQALNDAAEKAAENFMARGGKDDDDEDEDGEGEDE